jgi:hypothetical protein
MHDPAAVLPWRMVTSALLYGRYLPQGASVSIRAFWVGVGPAIQSGGDGDERFHIELQRRMIPSESWGCPEMRLWAINRDDLTDWSIPTSWPSACTGNVRKCSVVCECD